MKWALRTEPPGPSRWWQYLHPMTVADSPVSDASSHPRSTAAAQVAAWGFGFLILRIFAVSGYDWDTAFGVSTTLGLDDGLALVFGSLLAGHLLTAIALICVFPLMIAAILWGPRSRRPVLMLLAILSLVTLVALVMSFRSWWLPAGCVAVFGILALIRRLPPPHRLRRAAAAVMARVGSVAGLAVLLVAAFVQTPWVPKEQIETRDGTVSGFVLSVDPGYLNVLTEQHQFVILNSGNVLSRK